MTGPLDEPQDATPLTPEEREAFAMRLAAAVGLKVAPIEPRSVAGRPFLLIERYDREIDAEGRVRRLHQEDFCQAFGISPEQKYTSEGGPGFKDCFDLVRRACSAPAPSVLALLDAAIFNAILGNTDAHGKNFSLLYAHETASLSPLYDMLCTAAYPELSAKFSMRIAKRATLDEFKPDTWEQFANAVGVGAPHTRRRVRALAQAMSEHAASLVASLGELGLDAEALGRLSDTVCDRAKRFP